MQPRPFSLKNSKQVQFGQKEWVSALSVRRSGRFHSSGSSHVLRPRRKCRPQSQPATSAFLWFLLAGNEARVAETPPGSGNLWALYSAKPARAWAPSPWLHCSPACFGAACGVPPCSSPLPAGSWAGLLCHRKEVLRGQALVREAHA